jgi:pyruvate formate lyase activating enzyme
VGLYGCPLRCKLCINPNSQQIPNNARVLTPQQLFDEVKHDDILYRATNGGITFGGGEPCLYPEFIKQFSSLCPSNWNIRIETSLNVPAENILSLLSSVDEWFVDIKLWNIEKYRDYTGKDNHNVLQNLEYLLPIKEKVIIRVPIIEGLTNDTDADRVEQELLGIGFMNIQKDRYLNPQDILTNRKRDCITVRYVRQAIAKRYNIEIDDPLCPIEICQSGTCEKCEEILRSLEVKLVGKEIENDAIDVSHLLPNGDGIYFAPFGDICDDECFFGSKYGFGHYEKDEKGGFGVEIVSTGFP